MGCHANEPILEKKRENMQSISLSVICIHASKSMLQSEYMVGKWSGLLPRGLLRDRFWCKRKS